MLGLLGFAYLLGTGPQSKTEGSELWIEASASPITITYINANSIYGSSTGRVTGLTLNYLAISGQEKGKPIGYLLNRVEWQCGAEKSSRISITLVMSKAGETVTALNQNAAIQYPKEGTLAASELEMACLLWELKKPIDFNRADPSHSLSSLNQAEGWKLFADSSNEPRTQLEALAKAEARLPSKLLKDSPLFRDND